MIVLTATEFKAKCLELLDRVSGSGEVIQVTKRGKVVAEVRPPSREKKSGGFGFAKGEIEITGDIVEPLDEQWEAMR